MDRPEITPNGPELLDRSTGPTCEHGAYADLCITCHPDPYAARIAELEAEGLSTSDAQAVADAELATGERSEDPRADLESAASAEPAAFDRPTALEEEFPAVAARRAASAPTPAPERRTIGTHDHDAPPPIGYGHGCYACDEWAIRDRTALLAAEGVRPDPALVRGVRATLEGDRLREQEEASRYDSIEGVYPPGPAAEELPALTIAIDYDPALIDSIAWSAVLNDVSGSIAQFEGSSAEEVLRAAAAEIEQYVTGVSGEAPDDLDEPWSRHADDEHPIRWSPADGDTPAHLTLEEAIERLLRGGAYDDRESVEALLRQGVTLRTEFAFYQLAEAAEKEATR